MSDHSTHCRDPHCYGCSCTPDCDYWDEEQMNDYLDPATLTPETLYQLQAETWEQGATHERERIIKILATMRDTTHEDAWDTLDDAIDAINGVSQNYDIEPVSENPDNKGKSDFPFEYEGWN